MAQKRVILIQTDRQTDKDRAKQGPALDADVKFHSRLSATEVAPYVKQYEVFKSLYILLLAEICHDF